MAGSMAMRESTNSCRAADAAAEASQAVAGYVKLENLESLLLAYEEKKTPVGYTFHWSPVNGSGIDLSTAEKVAAHFGFGVWEQIKDTFLLASGDDYKAGTTGGNASHAITIEEIPSHRHELNSRIRNTSGESYTSPSYTVSLTSDNLVAPNNAMQVSYVTGGSTSYTGNGNPFDTMPPYLSVYIWKRIA